MYAKNKVTIIIPVYNEKKYIDKVIKRIKNNVHFNKQIIIVDDCSVDGTQKIIKRIKNIDKTIFHKKNLEKNDFAFCPEVTTKISLLKNQKNDRII